MERIKAKYITTKHDSAYMTFEVSEEEVTIVSFASNGKRAVFVGENGVFRRDYINNFIINPGEIA